MGKMRPTWAICMTTGQQCSRVRKKKFDHEMMVLVMNMLLNSERL